MNVSVFVEVGTFLPFHFLDSRCCCECLLYKYFRREHEISSLKCDLEDLSRAIDRITLEKVGLCICFEIFKFHSVL